MTEMLEPAPMFGDDEDYGGPIHNSNHRDTNNDNGGTDTEVEVRDSDESATFSNHVKIAAPPVEHASPNSLSVDSKQVLINATGPRTSNHQDLRATSAGVVFGEQEPDEENANHTVGRVPSGSNFLSAGDDNGGAAMSAALDGANNNHDQPNEYRFERRNCFLDFYSRLYAIARVRIFLSFLYILFSFALMLSNMFGALFILNELWSFKYPNANTNVHELWFAAGFVLLAAPWIICWAVHLTFMREAMPARIPHACKSVLIACFAVTPIGVALLVLYEVLYIYVYNMLELLVRCVCLAPTFAMKMNMRECNGRRAYIRFRRLTHMCSSSVPLMLYYGCLWLIDPYPRLKWKYLLPAAGASLVDCLFTLSTFKFDAQAINIGLSQYCRLALHLFAGFVPKLDGVANGDIKRLNLCSFALRNYGYAQLVDAMEKTTSRLETIVLTTSTLSQLSNSICLQFGAVCRAKQIKIVVLKNYSPYIVWFQFLFPGQSPYKVALSEFMETLRSVSVLEDRMETEFDELETALLALYGPHANRDSCEYYFRDFVNDWNAFEAENEYNNQNNDDGNQKFIFAMFDRLLQVSPPNIVANGVRDERLLNLVLGAGDVNRFDANNQASVLSYAIVQNDFELVRRLCLNGAKTSKSEWSKLSQHLIELVKENNFDALSALLPIIQQQRDEIDCDLSYHDQDGKTAIMHAAMNGNLRILQMLIESNLESDLGADVLHVDQDGKTAADLARAQGHNQVYQYLKDQRL